MTPIQKAKEIFDAGNLYGGSDKNFTRWLATPQAAALLSGEDWISEAVKEIEGRKRYVVEMTNFDDKLKAGEIYAYGEALSIIEKHRPEPPKP